MEIELAACLHMDQWTHGGEAPDHHMRRRRATDPGGGEQSAPQRDGDHGHGDGREIGIVGRVLFLPDHAFSQIMHLYHIATHVLEQTEEQEEKQKDTYKIKNAHA